MHSALSLSPNKVYWEWMKCISMNGNLQWIKQSEYIRERQRERERERENEWVRKGEVKDWGMKSVNIFKEELEENLRGRLEWDGKVRKGKGKRDLFFC